MTKAKKFLIIPILKKLGFELDKVKAIDGTNRSINYYTLDNLEFRIKLIIRVVILKDLEETHLEFYSKEIASDLDIPKRWIPIPVEGEIAKDHMESFLEFADNNSYIIKSNN